MINNVANWQCRQTVIRLVKRSGRSGNFVAALLHACDDAYKPHTLALRSDSAPTSEARFNV